jgi:phosphoribosyl 1,2-cyclic phosphate phosphodiesterase
MARLTLEFLGTGTSVGIPAIGCDCAVCTSADPRNKRLRSSALVRGCDGAGRETTVLIDTTPDFRTQMLRARPRRLDAIVITHYHADHVVGIDDVRRFNVVQDEPIDCWGAPAALASLRHSFEYAFRGDDNLKLGLPCLRAKELAFGAPFRVGCLTIEPLELDHEVLVTTGYLFTGAGGGPSLAYCLDVKRFPPQAAARLRGVHTLVLDMLRYAPHPTHLNLDEALATVADLRPQQVWFSHIAHDVEHAALEGRLPAHIRLACDGLVARIA